jgi:hypothetical protein
LHRKNRHIRIILFALFISFSEIFVAQCPNANFEFGNFTNWTGRRGTCCPINLPFVGIFAGRQTIVTPGIDPHSCGGLNRVYQGNFSARLGNDQNNARAEGLYYNFTVDPNTTLIQYAYAVVLQDPGHNDGDQPRFQSRVRLANGSVIPCTEYVVTAGPNLPGYNYCMENDALGNLVQVAYSDWRVISLDLSAYVGQSVTLEFETGDCDLGAHYGYAYIDAISCGPIETNIYYCQASDSTLIEGPEGFATYNWIPTGDTTRVITLPSNVYDTLTLQVTTVTGCELDLQIILDPIPLLSNIECTDICFPDAVNFINNTPPIQGYPTTYLWDFDDGETSNLYSPTHSYLDVGIYNVTMTAHVVGTNCTDVANCEVEVFDVPVIPGIISHD